MRKEPYRYSSAHISDVFDENGPNAFFLIEFLAGVGVAGMFRGCGDKFSRSRPQFASFARKSPKGKTVEETHTHILISTYIRIHTHTSKL